MALARAIHMSLCGGRKNERGEALLLLLPPFYPPSSCHRDPEKKPIPPLPPVRHPSDCSQRSHSPPLPPPFQVASPPLPDEEGRGAGKRGKRPNIFMPLASALALVILQCPEREKSCLHFLLLLANSVAVSCTSSLLRGRTSHPLVKAKPLPFVLLHPFPLSK